MNANVREFLVQLYTFSGIINVLTCSAIILFVLLKNRSRVGETFAYFIGTLGLWSLLYAIWLHQPERELSEFWVRTVMMAVIFMPPTFLHFVSEITQLRVKSGIHLLNYFISLAFALTVYHPLFAPYGGPSFLVFTVWPIAGPLFYFHFMHFTLNFGYGFLVLFRIAISGQEPLMTRIRPIFWGTLIGIVTGGLNFLPWFKIYVPPIFPPCIALIVVVFAYAIVRHQLMDIEVVIKRTLVFAGLVGSVVVVVSFVAFFTQDVLIRFVEIPRWFSNILAAAIVAATYGRVRNWLIDITDRYLFQKKYDYKELLKTFTDEVMVIVDIKKLVEMTVNTLMGTVKLENCSLLLLNRDRRIYELAAGRGVNGQLWVLEEQEPFVTFLRETHEPIGIDGQLGKVHYPESILNRMKQLHARLCLPLHIHEDLIGILCLGKKKSDEEFAKDDFDILLPLAKTLSIAVSNAQLFDELAKTQAEAAQKEKLAVIGTLSAGINHEICNPLGIVKAQCEAFLLDVEDGILIGKTSQDVLERTSTIMRTALKQIDRATAITQKLSNFAKPIKEAVPQPASVTDEVNEVLLLVGHDMKLEKIEVLKEIQQGLAPVLVDRRQFQEVLFNLIRNAGQAIKPPGTIWIRAYAQGDRQVRIDIVDTGSGIPPDKLNKVFDPFFTTKEPGKGTGLGLFIVRQIVERNKGRITLQSAVGKGTTFSLEFPAMKQANSIVH